MRQFLGRSINVEVLNSRGIPTTILYPAKQNLRHQSIRSIIVEMQFRYY